MAGVMSASFGAHVSGPSVRRNITRASNRRDSTPPIQGRITLGKVVSPRAPASCKVWFTSTSPSLQQMQAGQVSLSQQRDPSCRVVRDASGSLTTVLPLTASVEGPQDLPNWADFCQAASGEWDGYCVDFQLVDGRLVPQDLPYAVVPDAFREWGVVLRDWQTQCSLLADPSSGLLHHRVARLLPTVGCEADAATIHEADVRTSDGDLATPLVVTADGGFSVGWRAGEGGDGARSGGEGDEWLEEHVLPGQDQTRVRVVQRTRCNGGIAEVARVTVFSEKWAGEFRNGASLTGCGSSVTSFSDKRSLTAEELSGPWNVSERTFTVKEGGGVVVANGTRQVTLGELGLAMAHFLPGGVWLTVEQEDKGWALLAGYMVETGLAKVSVRRHGPAGDLKEASLATWKRS